MPIRSVALLSLLASTNTLAQPDIYFPEYEFNNAVMSAVQPDGSNRRVLFALPAAQWLPIGLTFRPSTGRLIWVDSANGSEVVSATTSGAGLTTLRAFAGFGKGASLDAQGRIYFSSDTRIHRVNADGSNLVTLFTSAAQFPVHPPRVDAVNGHLYFGDDGRIVRTDLNGQNLKVITTGVSQARAITLDIANRHIYWADVDTISDHIARSNLDGTEFTIVSDNSPSIVQSGGINDVLADLSSQRLYYVDDLSDTIWAMDLDGSDKSPLVTSTRSPVGLALSTGEPQQALNDCNNNGIHDDIDIANGAPDCDNNGVPDSCQINPCESLDLLLDQGSNALDTSGRALGTESQWQIFQPFDVPAEGWTIGSIGVDGYTVNYHDGSGFIARVFRDDGSFTRPDESEALATSQPLNLRFNTFRVNWVYAPLNISLPEGRFWIRLEGVAPQTFFASVNKGFSGLQSFSRGVSGAFTAPTSPIALRLVRGEPTCPADFDNDGFVDFFDFDAFANCFEGGSCPSGRSPDFDGDGFVDFFDLDAFVAAFEAGC
jgi:sugar lactone lactonase YvrE